MSNRLDELNEYIASLSPEERAKHEAKLKNNPQAIFELIKQGGTVAVAIAVENGYDLTIQDDQGMNPLHVAAKNGTELITEVLINQSSDAPFQRDRQGRLPLDIARENKHQALGDQLEQATYPEQFKELYPDNELINHLSKSKPAKSKNTEPAVLKDIYKRQRLMNMLRNDRTKDLPDR